MQRSIVLGGAAAVLALFLPGAASAQLSSDEQRCVNALLKDAAAVTSGRAKEAAACLKGAQSGDIADLGACLDAEPGTLAGKGIAKGAADAAKSCGIAPPDFGLPAAFDKITSEAGLVHGSGLVRDILGASPSPAGDKAGDKCQAAVVRASQKLVATALKSFGKCVATALKEGAASDAALLPCLEPDLAKATASLGSAVEKSCAGVDSATALPGLCSGQAGASLAACLDARAKCRACRNAATNAALGSDCDLVDDGADNDSCRFPVSLTGDAFVFNSHPDKVEGADIWILEQPDRLVTTGPDGSFVFDDLEEGTEVTLVLDHPDYHPIQNGTIRLGAAGAERVTFQAVTWDVFDALADYLGVVPDEDNRCQMVTTVTRPGKSIYDPGAHGEANARVSVTPAPPVESGPIYFNSFVLPDPSRFSTSDDGGVLLIQVPPGDYTWTATKGASVFTRIKTKCRAGLLVNASPPWGLQKH